MDGKLFFVTYKKLSNKSPVDETDYEPMVKQLNRAGEIIDTAYETDSRGKMHIHVIFRSHKKNPYIQRFLFAGYSCNFIPVYDVNFLRNYLKKETDQYQQNDEFDRNTCIWTAESKKK